MKKNNDNGFFQGNIRSFLISQIIIVIALIVVSIFSSIVFYNNSKSNNIKISQKLVNELSEQLEGFFDRSETALSATAETVNYMLQNKLSHEEIKKYLQHISKNSIISNSPIGFYGYIEDELIIGSDWKPEINYNPLKMDWYTEAKRNDGKTSIVSPYRKEDVKKISITLSKMLADKKSVVCVNIPLISIVNATESVIKTQTNHVFIMDRNGSVLAHTNENHIGKNYLYGNDSFESRLSKRIIFNPEHVIQFETIYNDKKSLVFSKKLLEEWYIVNILDESLLLKNTLSSLSFIIVALIILFGFLMFLCTSNFIARYKIAKYANVLTKHKSELEHQVVDQWNQLSKKQQDLVGMQECVIEGMATLIEYRDVNTGKHVQNTKHYVQMIAEHLYRNHLHPEEVNERYLNIIGNAAAMHDLGKVSISDRILNKPGKLEPEEFEMMKSHTIIGAGLVRQVFGNNIDQDMLRICIDVVQYHHEKWDGSGYPIGLIGEDIPLSARIMSIADVFDAVVSKRVYKDAVPVDQVFDIIKKDEGTHFDPELAEIFLSMKDEIKAYLAKEQ